MISTVVRLARSAAVLLTVGPAVAAAQDVLHRGDPYGRPAPQYIVETLERDPTAFEFRRAWRQKTASVRVQRAASMSRLGDAYSPAELAQNHAVVAGTLRMPLILATPLGTTPSRAGSDYQDRFFGSGAGEASLTAYYREISHGLLNVTGTVVGWQTLPKSASAYDPTTASTDKFGRIGDFLLDALTSADSTVDFGQFDNDGRDNVPNSGDDDGYVDVAAFMHPSKGKECGGTGIWAHRWVYRGAQRSAGRAGEPFTTGDAARNGGNIKVDDYIIQSGVSCGDGATVASIGTMAHETGHAFGLPDLYDRTGASRGLGYWCLMAGGNYNQPHSPANMSPWAKDYLGWLTVVTITRDTTGLRLGPYQRADSVLRINIAGTGEYFLIANYQKIGTDNFLRGTGLTIWHIDPSVRNWNDAVNLKAVDLEEADGLAQLDGNINAADAGDTFDGSTDRRTFDFRSNPSSDANAGLPSGIALRNINFSGDVARFDVRTAEVVIVWGDVNGDGRVTQADADAIYRQVAGAPGAVLPFASRGDVDADGDVDLRDALVVHSYARSQSVMAGFRAGTRTTP